MSKSNKLLVLGAGGLLGAHVLELACLSPRGLGEVVPSTRRFSNGLELLGFLSEKSPATVINCMGYLGEDPALNFKVNAEFPKAIAGWCQKQNSLFIHISTNAVFTPDETRNWLPQDPLGPKTPYEVSKARGEDERAYVIRASFIGKSRKPVGLYHKLLHGESYWDRVWNGATVLALARHVLSLARRYGGALTGRVEHVYSQKTTCFSQIAALLNSKSVCLGKANDSRLLGGGVELSPIEEQLEEYVSFLNRREKFLWP